MDALTKVQLRYPGARITKIVEAAQDLSFEIAERQIGATQLNPVLCAIGKALKSRARVTGVLVYRSRVLVVTGSVCTRYVVPKTLKREIDAFDKPGGPGRFKPGRYALKAPSKYERLDVPRLEPSEARIWERVREAREGKKTKTRSQPDGVRSW